MSRCLLHQNVVLVVISVPLDFELGESLVDPLQIFICELDIGGLSVLSDSAGVGRSRDRDDLVSACRFHTNETQLKRPKSLRINSHVSRDGSTSSKPFESSLYLSWPPAHLADRRA